MGQSFVIPAVFAVVVGAGVARAQDPGVPLKDFDQKRAGNEKMHMLAPHPWASWSVESR